MVHSARASATLLEEVPLGVGRRQGGGAFVGCRGLTVSTESPQQICSRGVERVVVVQVQLVHQRKRSRGASHLANGDGAVEGYDRCGGEREQLVVQGDDLRPVGLLDCGSIRMNSVDGGLELISTGLVAAKAPANARPRSAGQRRGPGPASSLVRLHARPS